MCVAITLAPGGKLSQNEVEQMNRSNADGVGIAWASKGVVQWWKTTKVDPAYVAQTISAFAEHPRLVHFRYSTAGGTRPELCHPFEVGPKANCSPVGIAAKVMIHNGHWGRWSEVKDLLEKEGLLPPGPWSDSRLAAYLAHSDPEWFEALGGRVAVMDGDGTIVRLGDWQELRPGVMVSNRGWQTHSGYTRGGYTGYRSWKGWQWDDHEEEAFYKEQAREKQEAAKAEEAANKKGKKNAKKDKQGVGEANSAAGATGPAPACGSKECITTTGPAGCADDGACALADEKPFFSKHTGKWYLIEKHSRGGSTLVEVAAPREEGTTSP